MNSNRSQLPPGDGWLRNQASRTARAGPGMTAGYSAPESIRRQESSSELRHNLATAPGPQASPDRQIDILADASHRPIHQQRMNQSRVLTA